MTRLHTGKSRIILYLQLIALCDGDNMYEILSVYMTLEVSSTLPQLKQYLHNGKNCSRLVVFKYAKNCFFKNTSL
jgi:hypothetical protein